MKQFYKLNDPFKGKSEFEQYDDISFVKQNEVFFTYFLFDCHFNKDEFLNGSYTILQLDNNRNIINRINLIPKLFQNDEIYPSANEVMLDYEDNFKSSLMVHNSYAPENYILEINTMVEGSAFMNKSSILLQSSDLIGQVSFRLLNQESYTHKIANGQVYNPEVYADFYKQFGLRWGGIPTAPKLPNLIGSFPRNIGTSGSAFAGYFSINDPAKIYIQRIPKIKWMNHLIRDHTHGYSKRYAYTIKASGVYNGCGASGGSDGYRETSNVGLWIRLANWDRIETGTNVNLNNYEFTNRFEPKCIEVIPFIRMI